MKKNNKTTNIHNIFRWILLVPVVLLTWYVVLKLLGPIPHLMFVWGFGNLWGYIETPAVIIGFFLPCIAVYFVAKAVAPKHKNIVGWCSLVLCFLYMVTLWLSK